MNNDSFGCKISFVHIVNTEFHRVEKKKRNVGIVESTNSHKIRRCFQRRDVISCVWLIQSSFK